MLKWFRRQTKEKAPEQEFGEAFDAILKLASDKDLSPKVLRQASLAAATLTYCIGKETITDALDHFRKDIPVMEKTIRRVFPKVDELVHRR